MEGPNGIEGTYVAGKPQTWEPEYGQISQKSIVPILRHRFGGNKKKDSDGLMGFWFSRKKLEELGTNYSIINKIEITKPDNVYGASGASGASTEDGTSPNTPKTPENDNNYNMRGYSRKR